MSAGLRFRSALQKHKPLQIVGTINAYTAIMAERIGHHAIYLSGAGVANASRGLPDLGITTLQDVVVDARRITSATSLPLLVDIDTGWDDISVAIREMQSSGVAAVHLEDQVSQKRCGHRPNKKIVSTEEMVDRIQIAVDARTDESLFIMARTDAFAQEGLDASVERAKAYGEAGADGIFAEAVETKDHYRSFRSALSVPILANITEFGKTNLWNTVQLREWGVDMVLYPVSAFRAMNRAAESVYETILKDGDQKAVLDSMQTREELYDYLGYHLYEQELDARLEKDD